MRSHADPDLPSPSFFLRARPCVRRLAAAGCLGALVLAPVALRAQPARQARLTVRVADESNAVLPHAHVEVQGANGAATTGVAAAPGEFLFVGLAPGAYLVNATHAGFAPIDRRVGVSGADDVRLDLRLALAVMHDSAEATARTLDDTSLKMPLTAHETPRSLTILDSARMREQNFRNVNDALVYVPGVSVNSYRTGGYHFYARGYRMLPNDTRVDGMAGVNTGGGFGASLFGVEEAVFLRGPAGLAYGSAASPGGMINLVTKKPQDLRFAQFDARAATYAGRGVDVAERVGGSFDIDATGSVGAARVLYRALASIDESEYFTRGVRDRQRHGQGALTFRLDRGGRTLLTPIVRWSRQRRAAGGGIVVSPSTSLLTNDGVSGPIRRDDLSSLDVNLSSGGRVDETVMAGGDLRVQRLGGFSFTGAYRVIGLETTIDQFTPQVSTARQRELLRGQGLIERVEARSAATRRFHSVDLTASQELWQAPTWKSLLQAGMHGRREHARSATLGGVAPTAHSPLDITTGQAVSPLVASEAGLAWAGWSDASYANAFVQNQTSLFGGRVVTTLGLGVGRNEPVPGDVRTSGAMPNAAIVFNLSPQWAVYASYATSFNPVDPDAEDAAGRRGTFNATRGTNLEAGVKLDTDRRYTIAASVFHTDIGNALVQSGASDLNPNGNRYFVAVGARRSRGVEVSVEARPRSAVRVQASASLLDAIYTGEAPASAAPTVAIPGSRAEKAPRVAASAWTFVQPAAGRFERLGLGAGVVYQGARLGGNGARTPSAPDPLELPAFARVDLTATWRFSRRVDATLHVENAFDALVFVNATVGSSIEIASPRALMLRVSARLFR